jgi:hypothetical protein
MVIRSNVIETDGFVNAQPTSPKQALLSYPSKTTFNN